MRSVSNCAPGNDKKESSQLFGLLKIIKYDFFIMMFYYVSSWVGIFYLYLFFVIIVLEIR
jgi:hypothetical protein